MPFDINTAVAVNNSPEGTKTSGKFDISTAQAVDVGEGGKTAYENFKQSQTEQSQEQKIHGTTPDAQRIDEGFLNGVLHSSEGAVWSTIAKPLMGNKISPEQSKDMDSYLGNIEKQHPIASVIGGTIPYIATAPLVPAGLLGVSAQFGAIAGLSAVGKARVDDASKPIGSKLLDIGKETAEGASFGPIWHYSAPLGWLGKAFVRGAGTMSLSEIYGDNITQAFKQGGIITALSLMFENPVLAKTVLGRGVIERTNDHVYTSLFGGERNAKVAETSPAETRINPDGSVEDIRKKLLTSVNTISGQSFNKSKIVSATIKLSDGTQIHAPSHEDALNKIGMSKDNSKEDKDFKAGFTLQNPDGSSKFITREESKQPPYNLKDGRSEDVPGLNQQKFSPPLEEPQIVNPDTLQSMGEEGKMDLALIPGITETAELLGRSSKELTKEFTPNKVGQEANITASTLRENLGIMARSHDQFESSLNKSKKIFDKATKDSSLDFIYRMEEGKRQESPELQKIHDVLRTTLDSKREEIRALGTGKLESFIENYFPHVWEKPNQAKKLFEMMAGKRPLLGSKNFLKQRTIESTRLGVDNGLVPVTYNPIDLTMLKVREMDRYLMGQKTRLSLRNLGLEKFIRPGGERPNGWVKINDGSSEVYSLNENKELVKRGEYYTQPDAARIINNYLSPGLRGNYFYDMYRGGGNVMNQFQLGISAFHLGFTSMDATVSKFALGINKFSRGDIIGAGKEWATAPLAPITNIIEGHKLLEAWNGKDEGEVTNLIANYMASAGGRAKMDSFYRTGMMDSINKSFKEGKILTGVLKLPFGIVEKMSSPLMEYVVPRQKMGVFSDLMKMELEKNPGESHEQLRVIAQRAWNSVDNRMGQLVYDNLFWNKTLKDLSMASVRSLGWNLGTIRELGGGLKDIKDIGKSGLSYRTAYVMALPVIAGLYGAIYQYLHTGQGPQELKDYFFPRNGNIDNKGNESRVSLPTYMKDVYHYTTNPVQTIINKFSPINDTILEMLNNKDFYGTEIIGQDDLLMQQIFDELKFAMKQFEPFSFSNLGRDTEKGIESKVEAFIGITPAPYDINMTKAVHAGTRTKEEAKVSQTRSKLRSQYFSSGDKSPLQQAVTEGTITKKEMNEIVKQKGMSNIARYTEHLSANQVMTLLDKANEKETEELKGIIEKKRANAERAGTWTKNMQLKFEKLYEQ